MIYNKIKHKNGLIANLYILFAGLALVMFYYAHAPGGIDKLFYVPCAFAFVMSVLYQINHISKIDSIDIILMLIIIFSILSDVLNSIVPTQFNANIVREIFGILCFSLLRKVNLTKFVRIFSLITPLMIASYYIFSDPFNVMRRYGGFSGDPNYLAISLNLLVAINLIAISKLNYSKWFNAVLTMSILGCVPLFVAGRSRAGIISFIVLMLFYLAYLFRYNRKAFIVVVASSFIFSGNIYALFPDSIDGMVNRFSMKTKADKGAATSRFDQIEAGFYLFETYPHLLPFGIGIDKDPRDYSEYKSKADNIVHSTYISLILGEGVFCFALFCILLYKTYKNLPRGKLFFIYMGLYVSLLLNIASVSSVVYLTFWWSLFFVQNPTFRDARNIKNLI